MVKGRTKDANAFETHTSEIIRINQSRTPSADKLRALVAHASTIRSGHVRGCVLNSFAQSSRRFAAADRLRRKLTERRQSTAPQPVAPSDTRPQNDSSNGV